MALISCSSSESPTKSKKSSKTTKKQTNNLSIAIPEQTLSTAEILAELKLHPEYSAQKVKRMRIQAAYAALNESQPIEVIAKIASFINPNVITTMDDDLQLANLFILVDEPEKAEHILDRLKLGAIPNQNLISMRLLSAQVATLKQQHLESLRILFRLNQLHAREYTQEQQTLSNALIWKNLIHTPESTLAVFQNEFGSEANSWLSLANVLNNFITSPERFNESFNNWYRRHSVFSSFEYLPDEIQLLAQIKPYEPSKIALLLPLTGKGNLSKQANAIRNGFLAGETFYDDMQIILFDTVKHSIADISDMVQEQQIDFIVGPLLKENINAVQQNEALNSLPRLNLNSISETEISSQTEQYFFALTPEDEIQQAVDYFLHKNIENPALIYADNTLGRRLASNFTLAWQQNTDRQPETIAFKSRSKLGIAVKELLDVGLSEQRINEIKKLFGAQIKSEQRSRKDIDAIYIIANSEQTRLIKPFFDVSVSTFGDRLPIYASSRSFVVGESREQKRDLNGLIFTEMKWMIENSNNTATDIYSQIGDNNTQYKKLFAFGFDARKLIPILKQLSALQDVTYEGLTGQLRVDNTRNIKRNLNWSQYRQGKVVVLQTE